MSNCFLEIGLHVLTLHATLLANQDRITEVMVLIGSISYKLALLIVPNDSLICPSDLPGKASKKNTHISTTQELSEESMLLLIRSE